MARRWEFERHTAEEIEEVIETLLHYRLALEVSKRDLEEAKAKNVARVRHFETTQELAVYARDLAQKGYEVQNAEEAVRHCEGRLQKTKNALRRVIPPGGTLKYTAQDGTHYVIAHRQMRNGPGGYIRFDKEETA